MYKILNQETLDKVSVNHYKSNFDLPTEEEWNEELAFYIQNFGEVFDENHRVIGKQKFNSIRKVFKRFKHLEQINNNSSEEDQFNKFIKSYNKYFEKQEKKKPLN